MELWEAVLQRRALIIDVILIGVLGGIHIASRITLDRSRFGNDPEQRSHASLRSATNAGMTVAGIPH